MSYTSPKEKLAEQFHMSPALLEALNPDQHFDTPGDTIFVANVSSDELSGKVSRIDVDKKKQVMRVFGKSSDLLAVYPITAGSTEKPAPDGELKVTSVSKNPTYHYNPKYAFKGVKTQKPFTIKPGPNNPVGVVWIGLNKEGYGIHGTPEPSKVSKAESHGCISLLRWSVKVCRSCFPLMNQSASLRGLKAVKQAGKNVAPANVRHYLSQSRRGP